MKFDVRVMATPKRRDYVETFCIKHNIPLSDISYDESGIPLMGAKKCWLSDFDSEEITHRLVLQDDIIITDNFFNEVSKMIEVFPYAVFSFYEGKDVTFEDKRKASPYIRMRGCCVWGQAILMPREYIEQWSCWIEESFPKNYKHDDCAIGLYCLTHGVQVFSTIPSLVQHAMPRNSTLRGHSRASKVSATWLGEHIKDLDWSDTNYNVSKKFRNDTWLDKEDEFNIKIMQQLKGIY